MKGKLRYVAFAAAVALALYVIFIVALGFYTFATRSPAIHGTTASERIAEYNRFDTAFNCFAELAYTKPNLAWNERVRRCIPDSGG